MNEEQVKAVAEECCIPEAWVRHMVGSNKWPSKPADFLELFSVFVEVRGGLSV